MPTGDNDGIIPTGDDDGIILPSPLMSMRGDGWTDHMLEGSRGDMSRDGLCPSGADR